MILAFDAGNTNIKVGLFEKDNLIESVRLTSTVGRTGDEYWQILSEIFSRQKLNKENISGVIMSSVNPSLNYTLENMVSHHLKLKPLIVGSGGVKVGINIKYDNPKEVGADRVVGAVAAYYLYGAPAIVVDCGTATTFNVINDKGEFIGGPISLGLKSASDALSKSAAKLPNIELTFPKNAINKNTIANMQSGVLFGFVGLVEYLVNKIKEEIGECKVIGTGGISQLVAQQSKIFTHLDRTLTLRGLNIIYNMNV